jgi:inner membrane protein
LDSVTQIVLGAAVGEICLGKKLGNRAMLWGGIAGTIPDLDVLSSPFLTPLQGLIFHRGISHSILFAVLFSFIMAWMVKRYYDSGLYSHKGIRIAGSIIVSIIFGGLLASVLYLFVTASVCILYKILILGFASFIAWIIYRVWKYYGKGAVDKVDPISYTSWYRFFFWTIFTHPILDCFTTYGTQLFAPFSDIRISWDNISVADPLYTIPFLICLVLASFYHRSSHRRVVLNYLGIALSTLYMTFTFWNKHRVNTILEKTLTENNIKYSRYMTAPTILNNVLWSAAVESDSVFYLGSYSLFDQKMNFKLNKINKNHYLLGDKLNKDYTIQKLRWFSKNYFGILVAQDGKLQMNDLRFGLFSDKEIKETDYVFRFKLLEDTSGDYYINSDAGRPQRGSEKELFDKLWTRIKGI